MSQFSQFRIIETWSRFIRVVAIVAVFACGCSPPGTGTVQVPYSKTRRETARKGMLPDTKTGESTI